MRSLNFSPTTNELQTYFKQKGKIQLFLKFNNQIKLNFWFLKGGKLTFADFLDVLHKHSNKEKLPDEIINAFRANDYNRTGKFI